KALLPIGDSHAPSHEHACAACFWAWAGEYAQKSVSIASGFTAGKQPACPASSSHAVSTSLVARKRSKQATSAPPAAAVTTAARATPTPRRTAIVQKLPLSATDPGPTTSCADVSASRRSRTNETVASVAVASAPAHAPTATQSQARTRFRFESHSSVRKLTTRAHPATASSGSVGATAHGPTPPAPSAGVPAVPTSARARWRGAAGGAAADS